MKKVLLSLVIIACASLIANAQDKKTTVIKDETTTKKTSTVPQKVHNTFSKHKQHNGVKTKHVKTVEKTTTDNATK